jgi:hypothetical protein
MRSHTMKRSLRKAHSCAPDLFDWARQNERRSAHAVRVVTRRARVSPALALRLAELAGLGTEAQHG